MIQKIRIRFIAMAMTALFVLLAVIVTGMNVLNYKTIVQEADITLEIMAQNKGKFPKSKKHHKRPNTTEETPYELRYFSVLLTDEGELLKVDTNQIEAVDDASAFQYATETLKNQSSNGFLGKYRFISVPEKKGIRITFLDCSREFFSFRNFLLSSILMALGGYCGFFFVILFFSNKITQPVTESYEKQRRFITDASHEIKTPLAIIQADVDVLEMEYGENEWLQGIQAQVKRLAGLTNDLVYLSRMEEPQADLPMIEFPFSDVVSETAQAFHAIAQSQGKQLHCHVEPMLSLTGNEKSIRQLVNILMDNAMKYSPEGGTIELKVYAQNRYLCFSLWNATTDPIEKQNLPHIFERFYRLDTSRNSQTGGYGIGLSVAKAIVATHNGKITATTPDGQSLLITVQFPLS